MKYKSLEKLTKKNKENRSAILSFGNKLLTGIFICLICLIMMEYSPSFKKFMQSEVLEENISFGVFSKLYNKLFGNILPNNKEMVTSVFKEKISYEKCENYQNGFKLTVSNNYLLPTIEEGIVSFIGEKEGLGSVIILEQTDGVTVTYGNIKNNNVSLYDHVSKGSFLGEVNGETLYIILLKDGEYLNLETYLS